MKLKAPITAHIEMTNNCNFLCKHCYNYWRYEEFGIKEYNEDNDTLFKILDQIVESEIFHIVITGGEPLTKFAIVKKFIQILHRNNVDVSMNSNLSILTNERAKTLKSSGLNSILTSLYSSDPKKNNFQMGNDNAFDKTLKGIEISLKNNIHISVNTVVDKNNVKEIYNTGKFLQSIGVNSFNATRFIPAINEQIKTTLNKQEVIDFLDQLVKLKDEGMNVGTLNPIPHCFENGKYNDLTQKKGCAAGLGSIGISANGEIHACQQNDISYGNVLENSIQEIWKNIPIWKKEYLPQECEGCSQIDTCGGGCRHYAYIVTNNLNGLDPLFSDPIQIEQKEIVIDFDSKYKFQKNIKSRDEYKGGILYLSPSNIVVLNEFDYNLSKQIYGHEFSINKLASITGIEKVALHDLLRQLYDQSIIIKS